MDRAEPQIAHHDGASLADLLLSRGEAGSSRSASRALSQASGISPKRIKANDFGTNKIVITTVGGNAVLAFGGGTVTLQGIKANTIVAADFHFAP
jgi:hypothetical protein